MEKFNLYSDPPMEIHSITELDDLFRTGGSISFRIPRKSKRVFVKQAKRFNRAEIKRCAQNGPVSNLIYRIYLAYSRLMWIINSFNQNSMRNCLWVYSSCISEIGTFKGENLSKDEILVTYIGRNPNSKPISNDPGVSTGFNWSEE